MRPVGDGELGVAETIAVNVRDWPRRAGSDEELTAVVVGTAAAE